MNFSNRLKEEIEFTGIQYKELATKADVKLRALFTYVATNPSMPPVDVAVRIAKTLGVTVEYLVDGEKTEQNSAQIAEQKIRLSQKQKELIRNFDNLSEVEQKAIIKLAETLSTQHKN